MLEEKKTFIKLYSVIKLYYIIKSSVKFQTDGDYMAMLKTSFEPETGTLM